MSDTNKHYDKNSPDINSNKFKNISIDESIKLLKTNISIGLTLNEVKERISEYGYNEIEEIRQSKIIILLKKFWGLTAWMLEFIIFLSWILGKYSDLYIITLLLLLNGILGFVEEQKAASAVQSLKNKLRINVRILRESNWSTVPSRELVPGDIIRVRSGDFVPADVKIITGELEVDQSAITGESLPILEKLGDILYSGSIVKIGEANGIVISTGSDTFFGKTVQLVQIAKPKLHINEVTTSVVKISLGIVGFLIAIAFLFSFLKGINVLEVLSLFISLLVSAIPVALPAMFTITMALGSMELAKKGILITRLSASEDAATMSVLCIDKTGTLTSNILSITDILEIGNYKKDDVIRYGTLSSNEANQDPIDMAFITTSKEKHIDTSQYFQKKFIPFSASTRRTESIIETKDDGKKYVVTKGALSVILPLCGINYNDDDNDNDLIARSIREKSKEFADKGYRTIAVAIDGLEGKSNEKKKDLVGIVALYDKPRSDSAISISELEKLGIAVKMLTGDSLPIAKEVARQTNLGGNVTNMSELRTMLKTDADKAAQIIQNSNGFAEVYPEDKYLLVKTLQSEKLIIGMTGDGVNDSPALRQAEVGIAVSNAADVAKGAASVVLTKEGLSNIVDLVKTGRMIYQRIVTWTFNKIIKTFQIVVFIISAFLLTGYTIAGTFEIILLLFLIDFVTLSISTDNVRWSKYPDTWNIKGLFKVAAILGTMIVVESLGLLYIGINYLGLSLNSPTLHTFVFDILLFSGLSNILIVRERDNFWKSVPSRALLLSIVMDVFFGVLISAFGIPGLSPIPFSNIIIPLIYCFIFSFLVNDYMKVKLMKAVTR